MSFLSICPNLTLKTLRSLAPCQHSAIYGTDFVREQTLMSTSVLCQLRSLKFNDLGFKFKNDDILCKAKTESKNTAGSKL